MAYPSFPPGTLKEELFSFSFTEAYSKMRLTGEEQMLREVVKRRVVYMYATISILQLWFHFCDNRRGEEFESMYKYKERLSD
jgi:hypothetical protein